MFSGCLAVWQIVGSSWTPSCASGAWTGCPAWPCMASCALPPATCTASWLSGARRPRGGHVPIWRGPRPMGSASWRKARRDQLWRQGPAVVSQQGLAWPAPRRLAGALGARATCGWLAPSPPPLPHPSPPWPRRPRGTFPTRLCLPRGPSPRNRPCSLPTPSRRWPSRAPAVGPPALWLVLTAAPPSSAVRGVLLYVAG